MAHEIRNLIPLSRDLGSVL